MKKVIPVVFLAMLIPITTFSQDNKIPSSRNELRINLLTSVIGYPEINYERFFESNFGIGIAGAVSLEDARENYIRSYLIPYGRLYFGKNVCTGFYIEGNTGIINEHYDISTIKFGIGVAVGFKFLARNNWVGDIYMGAGRIYWNSYVEAYPRVGISIGKRF